MINIKSGSKELIKEINRYKVLNIIRNMQPVSRNEISKHSDLGISTISYIMDELIEKDLIKEVGESTSTGGRRAKLYEFNAECGYVISVKVEEEQLLISLTNMAAELIDRNIIKYSKRSSPESIVDLIKNTITDILYKTNKDLSQLAGIGILSSGLINREEGVIMRSSILGWQNVPVAKMLQEYFRDIPIFVDKNINGYTLAELWKGEGKETNDFLVVSVGSGLGLTVVKDRKIYYGSIGGAGEFGHTTIDVNGYPCHCGQNGCLEMYASEFYFKNKGEELKKEFPDTKIKNFYFHEVAERAMENDGLALRLMKEMGRYLGIGIRNLINTLNPEKIVMAGEGMKYGHLFMDEVRKIAQNNFFAKASYKTEIVESKLTDTAWLMGGALLVINHLFQIPIYKEEEK